MPQMTLRPLQALLVSLAIGGILTGVFFEQTLPWIALSLPSLNPEPIWGWQLLTYPFALGTPIEWTPLLRLAVKLALLWFVGKRLLLAKGSKFFFILWIGATIACGSSALLAMTRHPGLLSGCSCILFSLFAVWGYFNLATSVELFPRMNIRAVWLLLALFGADCLLRFLHKEFAQLAANMAGVLFGWTYLQISFLFPIKANKLFSRSKIYDIRSGKKILNDDQFIDEMLARISLHGEQSLTPEEKERMRKISEKRRLNGR